MCATCVEYREHCSLLGCVKVTAIFVRQRLSESEWEKRAHTSPSVCVHLYSKGNDILTLLKELHPNGVLLDKERDNFFLFGLRGIHLSSCKSLFCQLQLGKVTSI